MKFFIASLLLVSISFSQDAYKIPFASKGNIIELTIANTASLTSPQITVEATSVPEWVDFRQKSASLDQIKGNQEGIATFSFSIDKQAPVRKDQILAFTIKSKSGDVWTKEIKIRVSPPEKFELFQNFPNPFNPRTTISYQLSADSRVSLKVYEILGREVATLVDANQLAGYHQELFDAGRHSSGVYIYRILYTDQSGKQASARKTMLLVK